VKTTVKINYLDSREKYAKIICFIFCVIIKHDAPGYGTQEECVSAISGYCGYIYIDYLKEQSEGDKRKLTILSGCQFVPIMDYICMRIIWKKYKKNFCK